jgi:hypothetical protein
VYRQRNPDHVRDFTDLGAGKVEEAVRSLDDRGRIVVVDELGQRAHASSTSTSRSVSAVADRAGRPAAHRHRVERVMRPGLAGRLSRFLVGCHPRRWRERYREEMLDVLDQHHLTARTAASLAVSTVSTHLDPAWRTERLSLPRLRRAALISAVGCAARADPGPGRLRDVAGQLLASGR